MSEKLIGRFINGFIGRFQHRLGIENTRKLSKKVNRILYRSEIQKNHYFYDHHMTNLLIENQEGYSGKSRNTITDGWAIDRSGNFPFIDETLKQVDHLIDQRGGKDARGSELAQTEYLFHLNYVNELFEYPDLLKFALSSEVIGTIADYMKSIPVLALTLPKSVRVFESTYKFYNGGPYERSQLFHRDIHDMPMVYVILLARDITEDNGPWCFLPESVSMEVTKQLGYQKWRHPYRLQDEDIYSVADPKEKITFTGKRGDVLFIDSSKCFHYGSRDVINPGYRIMYAFTTRCRSDFQLLSHRQKFPVSSSDTKLKRIILDEPNWQDIHLEHTNKK